MASRDPAREQYWRSLLIEWQQSKLSVYAFCKQRTLQKTTFYYWQRKLSFMQATPSRTDPAFVPMTLVVEPMVEVTVVGIGLKLPLAATAVDITRWLAAARASSC